MKYITTLSVVVLGFANAASSAYAADPSLDLIPEATLRSLVVFGPDESLKYADCEKSHFPTCRYIWGQPSDDDTLRVSMGGKPDGKKLMVIAAPSGSPSDFERVLAVYTDAATVPELGVTAVWSDKRQQLSMIATDSMIIHVNTQETGSETPRETAIAVAKYMLALP